MIAYISLSNWDRIRIKFHLFDPNQLKGWTHLFPIYAYNEFKHNVRYFKCEIVNGCIDTSLLHPSVIGDGIILIEEIREECLIDETCKVIKEHPEYLGDEESFFFYYHDKLNVITKYGICVGCDEYTVDSGFFNGLSRVKNNSGKFNFVNINNELISDKWFDDAGLFNDGYVNVELDGKWIAINAKGNILNSTPEINNKNKHKMKEAIETFGTFGLRLQTVMKRFANNAGVKRIFVHKDGSVDITFLFNGTDEEVDRFMICLNGQLPTVDNATFKVKTTDDDSVDYDWRIELVDVMVGK